MFSKPALLCLAVLATTTQAAQTDHAAPVLTAATKLRLVNPPAQLLESLRAPTRASAKPGGLEKAYDLFIRYADGTIYNPTTGDYDKVSLRAYQQRTDKGWNAEDPTSSSFLAPTVVMRPGQTVRFRLYNQLPEQDPKKCASTDINLPSHKGCFNVTNLHSHGLWVSPSGNSDNVLLAIHPNVNFEYEYNIPSDHPAGTFWYHPHTHGSTAMQVASGMAGALVVEGARYPTAKANGDLDILLKKFQPRRGSAAEVLLLQQIPYGCVNDNGDATRPCASGETAGMEGFGQVEPPDAWSTSGRYTSVNGKVQPILELAARQLHRWRVVDTGFQASIAFHIRRAKDPAKLLEAISKPNQDEKVMALCDGEDVPQFEVAADGLTHEKIIRKQVNFLMPGYRSDILFSLPATGAYCVFDGETNLNPANSETADKGAVPNTRLIGVIRAIPPSPAAAPTPAEQSPEEFLLSQLQGAFNAIAPAIRPANIRHEIAADLKQFKLSRFAPHPDFTAEDVVRLRSSPKEYVTFNIAGIKDEASGKDITRFLVEPADRPQPSLEDVYHPGRIDHKVVLGTDQMWVLQSKRGGHPFHIHVNPFQIISITNTAGEPVAPHYQNMVGTWKDTLLVLPKHKIEIATRYERYIGEYVLHCHILEHEDQGMMQNVKVVLPDGRGGAAGDAHQHH